MRVIVYHGAYGCDTGCCGHYVDVTSDEGDELIVSLFDFDHSYNEDPRAWAVAFARRTLAEQGLDPAHAGDLDWDNCIIVGDD